MTAATLGDATPTGRIACQEESFSGMVEAFTRPYWGKAKEEGAADFMSCKDYILSEV